MSSKQVIFAVMNDLNYDQRMIRICTSLRRAGYNVALVGRRTLASPATEDKLYRQKRLLCFFKSGFLKYAEFNIRLFFHLLRRRADLFCAIDLDTIMPVLLASRLRSVPRAYDAHELFCEMKEVVSRPHIYKFWKWVERRSVPFFAHGYTVNSVLSREFNKMYGVNYEVIRNLPVLTRYDEPEKNQKYLLYQGSVNEGRCFETLIPAMRRVNIPLFICGDGNFLKKAQDLVAAHGLSQKVFFKGKFSPDVLRQITEGAWLGVTLFDHQGLNNYYSLANRFFDYMHSCVPQICISFPLYEEVIKEHPFAFLIPDAHEETIAKAINELEWDEALYARLKASSAAARTSLNWQTEEKRLLLFYSNLFSELG